MSETHNQLVVSEHQINRAILLFLDENDYYCSATLAGAAEEILGALLVKGGASHSLNDQVKSVLSMLSSEEVGALADDKQKDSSKIVASVLNFYRNWLKHYCEDDFETNIDAEEAAAELIDRAITNFFRLTSHESIEMRRFLEYQQNLYS